MSGLANYIGTVGGILEAIEDPRFEGDFTEHLLANVEEDFVVDTLAARNAGRKGLNHVYEWGEEAGQVSNIPLFKLTRRGEHGTQMLSYVFLPSTKYVPLPHSKYGIPAKTISKLRRHVFQLKAMVMETRSKVTIRPVGAQKILIPTEGAKRGYVMKEKSVINPGGREATGGFAKWWMEWFSTSGQKTATRVSDETEKFVTGLGRKYVRYAAGTVIGGEKVGGRFATGRAITPGYIDSKNKQVKSQIMKESKAYFDKKQWEDTWSG